MTIVWRAQTRLQQATRRVQLLCSLAGALLTALGCEKSPPVPSGPAVATEADSVALTPDQASRVLAKVGDRVITLADYQAALQRMDRFERLRYQTAERRKLLLDELINVELLAREAERRGLDRDPAVQAELRVLQREEARRQLRATLPSAAELPQSEVRAYYDAHQAEFRDPERRRVAVLRVSDAALAERLLPEARAASPEQWGDLVRKHSNLPVNTPPISKNDARPPREFEGDLGLVSAVGEAKGENPLVVEPVRRAVFELQNQGEVYPRVVSHAGAHYLVRLLAKSDARQRSFSEAEPTLRVQLLQEKLRQAEEQLLSELQKSIPVVVNDAALAQLAASKGP